jgi:hypothetical protein
MYMVFIYELDERSQKYGKCLAATRRGIDQSTSSLEDLLPAFFLECERLLAASGHPFQDNLIAGRVGEGMH